MYDVSKDPRFWFIFYDVSKDPRFWFIFYHGAYY